MKVLVCLPCLLTGGTEIQTLSLVQALVEAGHKVYVACYFEFSPDMVKQYQDTGAEVFLLSPSGKRTSGIYSTIKHLWVGLTKVVKETKPDIVHVQYMAPGAIPVILLRLFGAKKILATAHTSGDIYSSKGLRLIEFLNKLVLTGFQCITERAERSFFGSSALFASDIRFGKHGNHFTIYNNLPSYLSISEKERHLKEDQEAVTIGVVSRLEPIKGMDLVIPAFAEIHKQFPNTRLIVIGDGTLRTSMERDVKNNGIEEFVEFEGRRNQSDLQDYYDRIDILLMPSRSEGFGLTAIEGMARGCVPIVSDTGGLPEVVRDGIDGLLHCPEDVSDLAAKICQLLGSPDKLKEFSERARQRAETFSRQAYNRSIQQLYTKVLEADF